jgi:Na+(H+)/acetate symporter ActP
LQKVSAREDELIRDPKEQQVQQIFSQRSAELAAKLQDPAAALTADRARASREVAALKASDAPVFDIYAADRALSNLPRNLESARAFWTQAKAEADAKSRPLNGMPPHAQQFAGDPAGDEHARHEFEISRRNFLALVFCLMVGTAALPHILIRYYTVPSVKEVRQSVTWSLLFIVLVYITAPALAVLVKYEVFTLVVGTPFSQLPDWITAWNKVDPSLLSAVDVNRDGILQLNELSIGGDIIMLAAPAIGLVVIVLMKGGPLALEAKVWGVAMMGASTLIFFLLPWLDQSPVKSIRYKGPLFRTALTIFVIVFLVLGYYGTQTVTPAGTLISQIGTLIYFSFFLLMPWYSAMDKTKPVPDRVTM